MENSVFKKSLFIGIRIQYVPSREVMAVFKKSLFVFRMSQLDCYLSV